MSYHYYLLYIYFKLLCQNQIFILISLLILFDLLYFKILLVFVYLIILYLLLDFL